MDRKKLQEAARAKQKSKDRIENVKQFAKDMGVDIVDLAKPTEEDVFVLGAMGAGPQAAGAAFALTRLRKLLRKIMRVKAQRKAAKGIPTEAEMRKIREEARLSPEERAMFDEIIGEGPLQEPLPAPPKLKKVKKVRKLTEAEKASEAAAKKAAKEAGDAASAEERAFMQEMFGDMFED